jgi:hypothetical protein
MKNSTFIKIVISAIILLFAVVVSNLAGNCYGWFFEVNVWQYHNAPNFFIAAAIACLSISVALFALVQLVNKE